jgi:hypothetical protein
MFVATRSWLRERRVLITRTPGAPRSIRLALQATELPNLD